MYLAMVHETEKRAVAAFEACKTMGLDAAIAEAKATQSQLEGQGYSYGQATMHAAKVMEEASGRCAVMEVLH